MPKRREMAAGGFTLLEVLVALVIASLALTVLFSGGATGLRSASLSGHYQEAIVRARSHLAALGHGAPLTPGEQSGDDGSGFHWQVQVTPLATIPASFRETDPSVLAHAPRLVLYAVRVVISWSMDGGTRDVSLDSKRLGFGPTPSP